MFKKNEKESKKFVLILCAMVFSFAAFIPVAIYLAGKKSEGSK